MWGTLSNRLHSDLRTCGSFLGCTLQEVATSKAVSSQQRSFIHSGLSRTSSRRFNLGPSLDRQLLYATKFAPPGATSTIVSSRPFTHCDKVRGEKQTDQEVVKRYFRLDWGGWLRRLPAANKAIYKMNAQDKYYKDMHYFVQRRFSKQFNRMVRKEYRTPKYFVDDDYAPYQERTGIRHYYRTSLEEVHDKLSFPEVSEETLAKRAKMMTESASTNSPSV